MGQAITANRPMSYRATPIAGFDAYRVNGTPADCVALGAHLWEKVDLVLSGCNRGLNLGNSTWHSGTLAAAKQAALLGMRGIAFSVPSGLEKFDTVKPWMRKVLQTLVPAHELNLVNVNLPREPRGMIWTRVAIQQYDGIVIPTKDPLGRDLYWFSVKPLEGAEEGTDRWAVEQRWISLTPLVLQVHPSVPAKTLKEFFELAKREPGKLNMASPGAGTTNHLLSELIQPAAGVSWTTVHYKGNAPATNDLIAGHVQFNFDQISVALPFLKDGRTRALAVTGTKRAHWIPDVPTFAELGYKDVVGQTFTALMAPAGTPAPIIAKLNAALTEILRDKDVIEKFDLLGAEAVAMSPDETRKYLSSDDATWMPLVRKANIKAE